MMQNFEPAFSQGEAAFKAGVALDANPHQIGSEAGEHWENGWKFAHDTKDMPAPLKREDL